MRRTGLLLLALGVLLAGGHPAEAQGRSDVGFGYSGVATLGGDDAAGLPAGWLASVGHQGSTYGGIVFEVAGNYGSNATNVYTYLGGVRITPGGDRESRPFVQVMGGAIALRHRHGQWDVRPGIEPGGGVDLSITRRTFVRVQSSVAILASGESETESGLFRVHVGVVRTFGGK